MKKVLCIFGFVTCFTCQCQVSFCMMKNTTDLSIHEKLKYEIVNNNSIINFNTKYFEVNPDQVSFFMDYNAISFEINKAQTVTDLSINYQLKKLNFGVVANNIFNKIIYINEIATELHRNEKINVLYEIEFTPQTSFFVGGIIAYTF